MSIQVLDESEINDHDDDHKKETTAQNEMEQSQEDDDAIIAAPDSISNTDSSESVESIVYELVPEKKKSPRKRKRGQFMKKETGTKEEKRKREMNRLKGIHHRRRTALYKDLLHLQLETGWEGLIILRSKDKKKVVCGGTDAELEKKFYNKEVLVENLDEIKKKDMHKVDMSNVMLKLSAVGKRMESVQESPDPSPSKIPLLARDLLPGQRQRESLENLPIQTADSMSEYIPVVSAKKKKVNVRLFMKETSSKKGKGRGKKSNKE